MPAATKRPNFLIIVADDLGYSDVGPFGSEIDTPTLDRLAESGVRLTNFHTASACSPTRSMLFSGTDNHIAGVGQMAEHMPDTVKGKPGYEGYLNFRVAALSEILQDAGYWTVMSGKWHLGLTKDFAPCSRGFDRSFVYLSGCHNHFNYEPQLEDSSHAIFTPMDGAKFWMEDDRFLDRMTDLPADFYSTTFFADKLVEYLQSHRSSSPDQPFFAYLPFTAPHWPLQAPMHVIEKYKGLYNDGPDALKQKRLQRLIQLGIIRPDVESAPMTGAPVKDWSEMTDEERARSAREMEVFAAMVDLIDESIGRVVEYLESSGELDDTFILFMSDNGAEGALLEALPVMQEVGGTAVEPTEAVVGDEERPQSAEARLQNSVNAIIAKYYDNRLENIGNADSYVWYGPSWACASMAPSRGFKTWITEGGIRCPCIVRYPPFSKAGGCTNSFATVMDILPTILDLAGVNQPGPLFRGRKVASIRGSSWIPHLSDKTPEFHDEQTQITGWELFGNRAIRRGQWKAVYMAPPRGKNRWELYDLSKDEGELHDLAEKEPETLKQLIWHWETYVAETGMIDPGVDFAVWKSG